MPNNCFIITAVQMVNPRGDSSLTIHAGIADSSELLAAQAVTAFHLEHAGLGFMPVATVSLEVGLEALEEAVATLKEDILPKRRGKRPRLAPGMIPVKQDPLSAEDKAVLQDYLKTHKPPAWGHNAAEGWANAEPEPEP